MTSELTFTITSLEKEAKPVGYVLVVGEGAPRGAAKSRRRAQRPVAHFSLLLNQDKMKLSTEPVASLQQGSPTFFNLNLPHLTYLYYIIKLKTRLMGISEFQRIPTELTHLRYQRRKIFTLMRCFWKTQKKKKSVSEGWDISF